MEDHIRIEKISDDEQKKILLDLVDKMAEVVYFWFFDTEFGEDAGWDEGAEGQDEEKLSDFIQFCWTVAMTCAGSIGLRPIGKLDNGLAAAQVTPVPSVKAFLDKYSFGYEGDEAYETSFTEPISSNEPYVDFDENSGVPDFGEFNPMFFGESGDAK